MKIRVVTGYPFSIAHGGVEVQAASTVAAIRASTDFDIEFLDFMKKEESFDIVHFFGNPSFFSEYIKFLPPRVKVVVSAVHGVRVDTWAKRTGKRVLQSMASKLGEHTTYSALSAIFRRADHVFALNSVARDFIVSRYGLKHAQNISVLANGVADEFFSETPAKQERTVLFTGSIIRRKNPIALVHAALSPELKNYAFDFVGAGLNGEEAYFHEFQELIKTAPNCRYLGRFDAGSADLAALFHRAEMFALPSEEETQSIALLEAIAAHAKPVLLDRAYARQAPFHLSTLSANSSPRDLIAAIRQAHENPQAAAGTVAMAQNVKTWSAIANEVVTVYKTLA